jgi:hypothetical protein
VLADTPRTLCKNRKGCATRPITSLAFVLTMGDVSRFPQGKQVAS